MMKKYFKVKIESEVPLYKQLTGCYAAYIADHLAGDKLPSERTVASFLGINRGTVRRVVNSFVDEGTLTRGIKGTFIADQEPEVRDEPHPLIFQNFDKPEKKVVLKLALYENMPNQKRFWIECVDKFNMTQSKTEVQIDWVSREVRNLDQYIEYIKATSPSLFQLGGRTEEYFCDKGVLATIPECAKTLLTSGDYWDFAGNHSIPIHFPCWGVFWNVNMVEKIGLKNVKSRIIDGRLIDVLKEARKALKDERIYVSGPIWNYLCSLGFKKDVSNTYDFFKNRFGQLQDCDNLFLLDEEYASEGGDRFMNETILFYISTSYFVSNDMDSYKFPLDVVWCKPEKGFECSTGASSIGVLKNCRNSYNVDVFVKYLLSHEAQDLVTKYNVNCAVQKEANNYFMNNLVSGSKELFEQSIEALTVNEFAYEMNNFITYDLRDLYSRVISGDINYNTAAELAMERCKV